MGGEEQRGLALQNEAGRWSDRDGGRGAHPGPRERSQCLGGPRTFRQKWGQEAFPDPRTERLGRWGALRQTRAAGTCEPEHGDIQAHLLPKTCLAAEQLSPQEKGDQRASSGFCAGTLPLHSLGCISPSCSALGTLTAKPLETRKPAAPGCTPLPAQDLSSDRGPQPRSRATLWP